MSGVPGMPWPAWDHGVEGRALWEPATPAEGGQRQVCRREGKSSPAHRACGGTPSPQGRFKYACSVRCAAGMRSVGVGRRRWVPGRRDKKKEKKKPKAKGSCPPPFFCFSTRASFFTSWRRLQGPSARRGMPLSWRGAGRVRDVLGLARPVRASEHGQGIAPWVPGPGREGTAHRQVWPLWGTYPTRRARRRRRRRGP